MHGVLDWLARFAAGAYAHTLGGFATAFVPGTLSGLVRQWRQRTAELRINVFMHCVAMAGMVMPVSGHGVPEPLLPT